MNTFPYLATQIAVHQWSVLTKAHTHTLIFGSLELESVLESADSSSELADSNADPTVGM